MHDQAMSFVERVLERFPHLMNGPVVEMGSRILNTSVRALFPDVETYIGVDASDGPGVDVVSLAHDYQPTRPIPLVLSCETLEHDPYWRHSLANMVAMLTDNGSLIITCASPERPAHEVACAPDGQHYQGLHMLDVLQQLRELAEWFFLWGEDQPTPGDTYVAAIGRQVRRTRPRTSIILPCVNRAEETIEAVDSMIRRAKGTTEIIVIDNGSNEEEARKYQNALPQVYLRYPKMLGYPKAVNWGIRSAAGEYVLLSNNDVIFDTDGWDSLLIETLPTPMDMVSPVLSYVGNPQQLDSMQRGSDLVEVEVLFFVSVLCNRKLFRSVGLLDEAFGLGNSEDTDFSIRVRQKGGHLYVLPTVHVTHEGHPTFLATIGREALNDLTHRNRMRLSSKWFED